MSDQMTSLTFKLKQIYNSEDELNNAMWTEVSKFFDINKDDFKLATHLLYNKYINSEIAYDTPNAFIRNLSNTAIEMYPQFVSRLGFLRELYSMSLEELRQGTTTIMNSASNPNEKVENPTSTIIDYITSQDTTSEQDNKFDRLNEGISKMKASYTKQFLNGFTNLFTKVYSTEKYEDYLYRKD